MDLAQRQGLAPAIPAVPTAAVADGRRLLPAVVPAVRPTSGCTSWKASPPWTSAAAGRPVGRSPAAAAEPVTVSPRGGLY